MTNRYSLTINFHEGKPLEAPFKARVQAELYAKKTVDHTVLSYVIKDNLTGVVTTTFIKDKIKM